MNPVLPGSTIGILGSGQLGRMLAMAAKRLGYRVHVFSPDKNSPAAQVCDQEWIASYEDDEALQTFARKVQVVTVEFENIPSRALGLVKKFIPVAPDADVLHVTQHRIREKRFVSGAGFPVTPYYPVASLDDLKEGFAKLKGPCVLKTADSGYDGKGQAKVATFAQAQKAFKDFGGKECILEAFVDFQLEVSVVAARGWDGKMTHFGVFENDHSHHILDVTVAPARIPEKVYKQAVEMGLGILKALNVVGVLTVEMFMTKKGELMVNELAPRVHNSGHLTIDANVTSQFEQHIRAVCGLPLGSTRQVEPAAMANLLGDVWKKGEPKWDKALADPDIKLHLYGKAEARPGRKMGHLTALGKTADDARKKVLAARKAL